MENQNRIQINGVWYVREEEVTKRVVKTVNWLIGKLQELAEQGYGECEVVHDIDYGNDWDFINNVEPFREGDKIDGIIKILIS
jgi:hypothetical protein